MKVIIELEASSPDVLLAVDVEEQISRQFYSGCVTYYDPSLAKDVFVSFKIKSITSEESK